jgi:hypothetical protein
MRLKIIHLFWILTGPSFAVWGGRLFTSKNDRDTWSCAVHTSILPSWTRMRGSCCCAELWTSRREREARRTAGSSTLIVSLSSEFLMLQ